MESLSDQFRPYAQVLCDERSVLLLTKEEHENRKNVVIDQWKTAVTFIPNWGESKDLLPSWANLCFRDKIREKLSSFTLVNEIYYEITEKYEFHYRIKIFASRH